MCVRDFVRFRNFSRESEEIFLPTLSAFPTFAPLLRPFFFSPHFIHFRLTAHFFRLISQEPSTLLATRAWKADIAVSYYTFVNDSGGPVWGRRENEVSFDEKTFLPLGHPPFPFPFRLLLFARPRDFIPRNSPAQKSASTHEIPRWIICAAFGYAAPVRSEREKAGKERGRGWKRVTMRRNASETNEHAARTYMPAK